MTALANLKITIKKLEELIEKFPNEREKVKSMFEEIPEAGSILSLPIEQAEFAREILEQGADKESLLSKFESFNTNERETIVYILKLQSLMMKVEKENDDRVVEMFNCLSEKI